MNSRSFSNHGEVSSLMSTFDSVHPVLESGFLHRHVGYHHGDVAEDGGEDEDTHQEVPSDKEELSVVPWLGLGSLPDGGEGEGGPVETVDIL